MPALVLDASATASCLFKDEVNGDTEPLLTLIAMHGAAVPGIWVFEVTNFLRQGECRGRLNPADFAEARELLQSLAVEVEQSSLALVIGPVLDLARRHSLTACDASYLQLALRLRLPLATRDAALIRAAGAEAVPLLAA